MNLKTIKLSERSYTEETKYVLFQSYEILEKESLS